MRLNGAALNTRGLNASGVLYPELLSGDLVGTTASSLDALRLVQLASDASVILASAFDASVRQFFEGDLSSVFFLDPGISASRIGSGDAIATTDGGLYYTRIIYGNASAITEIIAISDVGVVYGDGSGVMLPLATMDGARRKPGFGDSIATTAGDLSASAIRVPYTADSVPLMPWMAELDSATVLSGGIRRIDGFGGAVAHLEIVDGGMIRQVFIGSLDLEPSASGFATAVRNAPMSDAVVVTTAAADFEAYRTAAGDAVAVFGSSMTGEIFVLGDMEAVIEISSAMTGTVFRRGGAMEAISTMVTELAGLRAKAGYGDAPVVVLVTGEGLRGATGSFGPLDIELFGESSASDYNFAALDDDTEIFYRPASVREFAKSAFTRELRRS